MVQFGLNAGPCHLCVFGHVHNIKKIMPDNERLAQDQRILGAFGLVWNILHANLPREVIGHCDQAMDVQGMPSMSTVEDTSGR
jgi:hypothetical protein